MGRASCSSKEGLNRGAWTALEDKILTDYIKTHGAGRWRNIPNEAGLKRCGKSCRLRWINYLSPHIKRGNISHEEEDLILRLHRLLGNRWSLIARRMPGRTDNEIKNYWNTILRRKVNGKQSNQSKDEEKPMITPVENPPSNMVEPSVIRPKAVKCSKVLVTPQPNKVETTLDTKVAAESSMNQDLVNNTAMESNFSMEFNVGELFLSNNLSDSDFWEACGFDNGGPAAFFGLPSFVP